MALRSLGRSHLPAPVANSLADCNQIRTVAGLDQVPASTACCRHVTA